MAILLLATIGYAVLRYHVFKGVPWDQFALFILNKAVALFAICILGFLHCADAMERRRPGWGAFLRDARPALVRVGFASIVLHSLMSLLLMRPEYFPSFFRDQVFSLMGGFAMLAGLLAFALYMALTAHRAIGTNGVAALPPWPGYDYIARLAFYLLGLHAAIIGCPWTALEWPGGLPPITLLSVVIVAASEVVRRLGRLA